MRGFIDTAVICVGMILVVACTATTEDTHHLKNVTIKVPENGMAGLSTDAKQRFIWAPSKTGSQFLCAEPSPDALSQLASAVALQAQVKTARVEGGFAYEKSFSETAKNIGKRTVSIQLLRDGLYRACEAFINGAIDAFGYSLILAQIDNVMIKLMALETLGEGQPAPDDSEGKKKIQDAAKDSIEAELAQNELQIARQDLSNREQEAKNALRDFENDNAKVTGTTATIKAVDTKITAENGKGDNKDAAKIEKLEQQKIGLTGQLASAKHLQTTAKTVSTAATEAVKKAKGLRDTAATKARTAAEKAKASAALEKTVDKILLPGAVGGIQEIVTHSDAGTSLVVACLMYFARHDEIHEFDATGSPAIAKLCGGILKQVKIK